ncbi:hypothetical protein EP7_002690 [Isosphaeraceae bacterium EP7]
MRSTIVGRVFGHAMAALVGALVLTMISWARPIDAAQGVERTTDELAEARVALARKTIAELSVLAKSNVGDIALSGPEIAAWRRRIAETRHELGGQEAEVIADLAAYLKFAKEMLDEAKFKAKTPGASIQYDVAEEAEYRVLEAESWLVQAKARLKH